MRYYINKTDASVTIHTRICHGGAGERYGPFENREEAEAVAAILVRRFTKYCEHCERH